MGTNRIVLTTTFALCALWATGNHQTNAPEKPKPTRPGSYKKLVALTQFDPATHRYFVEKARSILKSGQNIEGYVRQKVIKQYQKMNVIFATHGLSSDDINQIWHEQRLILATHQYAEADKRASLPSELAARIISQLTQYGVNPTRINVVINRRLDAQAKTRLLDDQQQLVEFLELNPKALQHYPRECQEAIINHEAAHLKQHDMLLRILLDAFHDEGKMKISQRCRNAICRTQERCADYLAADTARSARNLRALIVAWYRKYGPGYFFSEDKQHPSPYQRFCKINKIVLLHEAAQYIQTGAVPAEPPFPHYQMRARDHVRRNENKVIGLVTILSGIGLLAYAGHTLGLWGKPTVTHN